MQNCFVVWFVGFVVVVLCEAQERLYHDQESEPNLGIQGQAAEKYSKIIY